MWRFRAWVIFFGVVCMASSLSGQDYVTWSSLNFKKKIDKEYSIFLKPIVRHNLGQSRYLNWSPDYAVIRRIDKNWSMMLFGRTWLIPNGPNRQFLFFDVRHSFRKGKIGVSNSIRIHQALDIEREDPDFLRWHSIYSYKLHRKITPFTGIQMFIRMNGIENIQRMRYVLGCSAKLTDKIGLNMQYWREQFHNTDSNNLVHIFVTSLSYSL